MKFAMTITRAALPGAKASGPAIAWRTVPTLVSTITAAHAAIAAVQRPRMGATAAWHDGATT